MSVVPWETIGIIAAALIAAGAAIASPNIIARRLERARAREREEDRETADRDRRIMLERQDAVAEAAKETARVLREQNELVAERDRRQGGKLDQIHDLVNSNVTGLIESNLTELLQVLSLSLENVDLNRRLGVEPSPAMLGAVAETRGKIAELQALLQDRQTATETADAHRRDSEVG